MKNPNWSDESLDRVIQLSQSCLDDLEPMFHGLNVSEAKETTAAITNTMFYIIAVAAKQDGNLELEAIVELRHEALQLTDIMFDSINDRVNKGKF